MTQPEFVLANKVKLHREAALDKAKAAREVLVAKGKKLLRFETASGIDDEALAAAILGRSGTLRAPAIHVGDIFLVGFHAEGYEEVFG